MVTKRFYTVCPYDILPIASSGCQWSVANITVEGNRDDAFGISHDTQSALLSAATAGIRKGRHDNYILLVTDSEYLFKGITEWRKGWERRRYRNAKGDLIAHMDLWKELFALCDKRSVTTKRIKINAKKWLGTFGTSLE